MEGIITGLFLLIYLGGSFFMLRFFAAQIFNKIKALDGEIKRSNAVTLANMNKMNSVFNKMFIFPDSPSPNEATKVNKDEVEFSENDPINLPPDVKIELEGGDSHIPPGYEPQAN